METRISHDISLPASADWVHRILTSIIGSYRIFVNGIYSENMMRRVRVLLLWIVAFVPSVVFAQYANSWINFSQPYYKIPVTQNGIYRLTYANLQAAGFPVSSVDPRNIQVFHRGQEQSIYIKGQADTHFDPSDYLEFYGQRNDGTLDSNLYQPSSFQPHKFYNLYSDTAAYFLTYNSFATRGMRMDSTQLVNISNLPAENYQLAQRLYVFHNQYSAGFTVQDVTQSTAFDQGEGWTDVPLQQGQFVDYIVDSVYNGVSSSGNPKLELLLVGRDAVQHSMQVLVGPNIGGLRVIASPVLNNFETYKLNADLNWSDIGADGKMTVRIVAQSATTNRYQASASYIKVGFPQSFDLTGLKTKPMQLAVNPLGESYVVVSNPRAGLRLWDITDLQNITRIFPPASSSSFNVLVPATSVSRNLFASSRFLTAPIIPISFQQINPSAVNYLLITNNALMQPGLSYANAVQAFADYRASSAGGSYNTLVVTVDQLFNQFNYGETSPLAIYSFMKFMISQGTLKYLFLIGKGRDIYDYSPYNRLPLAPSELPDLVPSAGYPGGDINYTAGLNGTTYDPAIPTGRLTAITPDQVAAYLNKVKELESVPLQPWAKEILHLSGGGSIEADSFELSQFLQIMNGFKQIAEGPYLGGHVTTQAKQNLGIEKINVSPIVNQGVNLVTFFGHASSTLTEIDIGFVDDPTLGYNNPGKYPVFLIDGCNAGAIFENGVTFTDNWMLAAGKGSRNFIAGTSFGFPDLLQNYTDLFYGVGFGDSTFIKKGIGDTQKETCRRYLSVYGGGTLNVAQVQQMVLAGDPALKLFGTSLPDYSVDSGSLSLVSLDGKPVTSLSDSFGVKMILKNLGAYNPKPVKIRIEREFNDNTTQNYDSTYSAVFYADTLIFKIPKGTIDGFGNNSFTVIIDPLDSIKEITKANNEATLNVFIPSNGTLNLYPPNFGIVPSTSLNLVFQDANLLGTQRNFLVQVDTSATFNSAFVIKQTASGKVLAKLPVNLLSTDSLVYYWRTKLVKQSAGDSANWTTSSFIYIDNSPEGWAQKKFPQVEQNTLTQLNAELALGKLNYIQNVTQVSVKSIGVNSASSLSDASFKVDNFEYDVPDQVACRTNTINLVAFNKTTTVPYAGIPFFYDTRACGFQPSVINSFLSTEVDTGNGDDLVQCITNIHASDSVILFSVGNPAFSSWSSTVLSKLNELGISDAQITSLQDGEPVVIFARKGATPGSATVHLSSIAPVTSQDVAVTGTVTGRYSSGTVKSPAIGPAKSWVKFEAHANEVELSDQFSYSIYGVSLTGQETLIQANITGTLDLSFINPVQYPQLKVELDMQDTVNLTPVQIKNWFVFYESVADGLLFYKGPITTQTVQEGQLFTGQYGFTNISSKSFTDSLQVSATIINTTKAQSQASLFKIVAPAPGDTTNFAIPIATKGKAGLNNINVFVNPKIQPEQYYENNVIDLSGYLDVLADQSDPSLDVTVDGRYLLNGDFVSPSPAILIKLHDDNPFLFITDTTHLNVFLSYPCDTTPCPFTRINFNRGDVTWAPSSSKSDFTFNFKPLNLPEGTYTLQVNGSDASGNPSGAQPYEVTFVVKDQTTLALNSVYPNPSSDIFNFSFVLSGNVLPDALSLQIYSSDGVPVQQFGMSDISRFIIGTNDLQWSAAHANLLNGLFVYRLSVSVNGKTVSESGKIILIR